MKADRRMDIALDGAAMAWLGDHGYDPVHGARPLKRVIQKSLVDLIARKLFSGELADGAVIEVGANDDGLEIERARVHFHLPREFSIEIEWASVRADQSRAGGSSTSKLKLRQTATPC